MTTNADRHRAPQGPEYYLNQGQLRNYFYVLNTRGELHLEESCRRNFTTCFKDKKFLTFFYSQLRASSQVNLKGNIDSYASSCPYVSLCGNERNFVTPEDPIAGIVFIEYDASSGDLVYPGGVREFLCPGDFAFSISTGRLYHPVRSLVRLESSNELGLLHPVLCQQFAERIVGSENESDGLSINWFDGKRYGLRFLP